MDIPTPFGSEAYAIDDGIVRIGGLFHSAYSDGVVQVGKTYIQTLVYICQLWKLSSYVVSFIDWCLSIIIIIILFFVH